MTHRRAGAVLAIDLGGTRVKSGVVDEDGRVHHLRVDAVPPAHALDTVLASAIALHQRHGGTALGLCVPGIVDGGRLIALAGKLAGLEGVDLAAVMSTGVGLPARVLNDAIAYAAGEASAGAARGCRRAVVVTIGTGVGVGVVEDGAALGSGPFGGGILGGQIPIAGESAAADSSGRRGTIESLCAAQRIVGDAGTGRDSVEDVVAAAVSGDARATAAVEGWRVNLVRALVALAHAHGPEVIVVGGGPMVAGTPLLDGVERRVNEQLYRGYTVHVRRAELGDAAALIGVAQLAREAAAAA